MAICLLAAGHATVVAVSAFTLAWTHSVEKVRWEEDWRLTPAGLQLVEARVKGSGAGMEVPEGAVLKDGAWAYAPDLPPQAALLLARSGATGGGWEICGEEGCTSFGDDTGAPLEIRACPDEDAVEVQ